MQLQTPAVRVLASTNMLKLWIRCPLIGRAPQSFFAVSSVEQLVVEVDKDAVMEAICTCCTTCALEKESVLAPTPWPMLFQSVFQLVQNSNWLPGVPCPV